MSTPSTSTASRRPIEEGRARPVGLSVIMPGFNEEASVERAVGRMRDALDRLGYDFEIIIIDDGSKDRTGEIADRLADEDERVRVLHNERNVNYGVSLRRGIEAACCEWVLHDGMDLPLGPEDIGTFARHFSDADVVTARRANLQSHSPWRRVTSIANNLLLRFLFRPRTSDLNFVQFYRRAWLQSIEIHSTSPAVVTPELILRAERTGKRVREVEAEFRKRSVGRGHFGKPKDILWTLKDMLRLRFRTWMKGWQ